MKPIFSHSFNVSPKEAIKIQNDLKELIRCKKDFGEVKTIAGVDVGFKKNVARAAVVVLSFPKLSFVEKCTAEVPINFPYIPGLLVFREGPAVLAALEKLEKEPDLFIFDAQGYAHPRRMGLATHIGVLFHKPSIGCAKSKLWGNYKEPENKIGAYAKLFDDNEVIGAVVRSKVNSPPLFVSVGQKIDLESAVKYVLLCTKKNNRLPETTLFAHKLASGESLEPVVNSGANQTSFL